MKQLLILIVLFNTNILTAQTWQSIPKDATGYTVGWLQFTIDPYTNNIWLNAGDQVTVIENNGTMRVFNTASGELGAMWETSELQFAFTLNHVYCASNGYGLRSFDNYFAQQEYSFSDYVGGISTNQDSVYILDVEVGGQNRWVRFIDGAITLEIRNADYTVAKNEFQYSDFGSLVHYTTGTQFVNITTTDPEYLLSAINDMKFTRLTDTIYVSGLLGINKIFNYDVFDTITPNNTTNMPSPNVLEMEFDLQDDLWAVFGDANDDAFAVARLDGSNWVELIDGSNSPIDFSEFHGLEIDTTGNLWFNDKNGLHTIVTATSPDWLNTDELASDNELKVYPNPTKELLHISSQIKEEIEFQVLDAYGRSILIGRMVNGTAILDISTYDSGIYFLNLNNGKEMTKIIKD
jgi:hypothetical protein